MFYYFSVRALSSGKDGICLYVYLSYKTFQKADCLLSTLEALVLH